MATVDAGSDDVWRYVVQRYAYDPERHERRHQAVAAFDNEGEFKALIDRQKEEIDRRRALGDEVSPLEYYSGVPLEPGYRRRTALQRLAWRRQGEA